MGDYKKSTQSAAGENDERWERELITKLAVAVLTEQRRARRWGIFFKLLIFLYLLGLLVLFYVPLEWAGGSVSGEKHTALINVEGVIAGGTSASAENIIKGLRKAFDDEQTAGVVLHINSPGGSPVQAGRIYDEIRRLRQAHPDIPVYAVASDVCASGAYYIAVATQEIYADKASLVGSIGVRSDSFGFVGAMEKLGLERRLYTAGDNKALLDPFMPERPEEVRFLQGLLTEIHQQFIDAVRSGRGARLGDEPTLFSGLVWTGAKSVELGLIDGLADVRYIAEEVIGAEKIVDYSQHAGLLRRLLERVQAALDGRFAGIFGSSGFALY